MVEVPLKQLVERAGKTLYQLEQETKISHCRLRGYRDSKAKLIGFNHIELLCKSLNCTPAELIIIRSNGNGKNKKPAKKR